MTNLHQLINWARKAGEWQAPVVNVPAAIDAISALPEYDSTERYPCSTFTGPRPQYFVAKRPNGDRFVVDTQGYDYARYIAKIEIRKENPMDNLHAITIQVNDSEYRDLVAHYAQPVDRRLGRPVVTIQGIGEQDVQAGKNNGSFLAIDIDKAIDKKWEA